jgi:hypothetical protein
MDDLTQVLLRLSSRLEILEIRVSELESLCRIIRPAHACVLDSSKTGPDQTNLRPATYSLRTVKRLRTFAGSCALALPLILTAAICELTLNYRVLSPSLAAALLTGLTLIACSIAWRRNLAPLVWLAAPASVMASIILLIGAHAPAALVATLLLLAGFGEVCEVDHRWPGVRPIAAVAADVALCALLYLCSRPAGLHASYAASHPFDLFAPVSVLSFIYVAGATVRTGWLRKPVQALEAFQITLTVLLTALCVLRFANVAGLTEFGVLCLVLSAAGYTAANDLLGFGQRRNYQLIATWSLALCLLGCFLSVAPAWQAPVFAAAAVVSTCFGVRGGRLNLGFNGVVYLLGAAFASGLLPFAARTLAGTRAEPPAEIKMLWIIGAAMVLCYAIGGQIEEDRWSHRAFHTLSAILALAATATALVCALVWGAWLLDFPADAGSLARTLAASIAAIVLAYLGPRWHRIELVWLAYASLALIVIKLIFVDLPSGQPNAVAASVILYAVSVLFVPRLTQEALRRTPRILLKNNPAFSTET